MKPREALLQDIERAYERGRWLKGIRTAALVIPMMLVSFGCCGNVSVSAFLAALLAGLVTFLVWRGGSVGRAVVPGIVAGIASLAIPLLACPTCAAVGITGALPLASCVAGGVVSGATVVHYASRESEDRAAFVFAGGAVAALGGSLGCFIVGLGGVAAMAVGLALVTPFALRGARASG